MSYISRAAGGYIIGLERAFFGKEERQEIEKDTKICERFRSRGRGCKDSFSFPRENAIRKRKPKEKDVEFVINHEKNSVRGLYRNDK